MLEAVSHIVEMPIKGHASLHHSAPDPLEKLLRAHVRTFKPGQFVIREGDETSSVICLLGGWLSLSKSLPDGETQIVDFALPGEIIETGITGKSLSVLNIEALTAASLAIVPVSVWDAMKHQRADLRGICDRVQAASRSRMAERMLRLGRGRAAMRMAYALLELNIRLGAIGQASGGKYCLPMNQRVLGDFIGLSSVHVCRTLGRLVDDGVIRVTGQMNIEILDVEKLTQMAGVDRDILQYEILAQADGKASTLAYAASA